MHVTIWIGTSTIYKCYTNNIKPCNHRLALNYVCHLGHHISDRTQTAVHSASLSYFSVSLTSMTHRLANNHPIEYRYWHHGIHGLQRDILAMKYCMLNEFGCLDGGVLVGYWWNRREGWRKPWKKGMAFLPSGHVWLRALYSQCNTKPLSSLQ